MFACWFFRLLLSLQLLYQQLADHPKPAAEATRINRPAIGTLVSQFAHAPSSWLQNTVIPLKNVQNRGIHPLIVRADSPSVQSHNLPHPRKSFLRSPSDSSSHPRLQYCLQSPYTAKKSIPTNRHNTPHYADLSGLPAFSGSSTAPMKL